MPHFAKHGENSKRQGGRPTTKPQGAGEACPPLFRGQKYPKALRLLKRAEFLALKSGGVRKKSNPAFLLVCKKNHLGHNRLGLTAGRKTGSAVDRNRFKRRVREFFRLNQQKWPQGFDYLFIANRDFKNRSNEELWKFLNQAEAEIGQ